jgi:hypothetical protein
MNAFSNGAARPERIHREAGPAAYPLPGAFATLASLALGLVSCAALAGDSLTAKYFSYRERLRDEFMLGIGPGFGESLPASIRNGRDRQYRGRGTIQWGDATIDLAVYIGVLAIEYRLLAKAGSEASRTLDELFFALEAFNRLDQYGNGYFGAPDSLDGFFVRSDVGRGLHDGRLPNERYAETVALLNRRSGQPVDSIYSEWVNYRQFGKIRLFAASKDQAIHVLAALALVKHCLPGVRAPNNGRFRDGETAFDAEARNIAGRILAWMHPPKRSNFISNWTLRRPGGGRVPIGYNAWAYAPGLARMANALGGPRNPRRRGPSYWLAGAVYHVTWFAYRPVFLFNPNEGLMTLTLAAVGHGRANPSKVYRRAHAFGDYTYFHIPLLHGFLHGRYSDKIDWAHYRKLLEEAPPGGPEHWSDDGFPARQWSSTSLLIHPQRRGERPPHFPGRYNGLGYMLLYNLYLLGRGETY